MTDVAQHAANLLGEGGRGIEGEGDKMGEEDRFSELLLPPRHPPCRPLSPPTICFLATAQGSET